LSVYQWIMITEREPVLVDVDEVLGDFQTPALKIMSQVTGQRYQPGDFTTWDIFGVLSKPELDEVFKRIGCDGFASCLEPTPGSQDFIRELSKMAKVYIVTSPFPSRTWASERTKWVKDHFDIPGKQVIHTAAKYLVRGRALLDDKPEHTENWLKNNPKELAMLWHIPNTRTIEHPNRVKTWDEALSQIEKHLCP